MKNVLGIVLLFLSIDPAFSQSQDNDAELRRLEVHWTKLLESNDTTALRRVFTTNYVVNNASGKIVSVEDIFRLLKSGHVFPKVDRHVEKITFNGQLAIVMGSETEYGKNGEKKMRRFTNVWIQTSEGWKLVARQATGS